MSEFKFACPVCGQHITCDVGSSGTQMDCPTCFRKLIVPQAPASGSNGFVLTAAQVQTRSASSPPARTNVVAYSPASRSNWPVLLFGAIVLMLGAGAGILVWRGKIFVSSQQQPAPPTQSVAKVVTPVVLLPPSTNWTLNLTNAKIPNNPAGGMVMGRSFSLERAVIQGGRLDLRQGTKWPPDVGLSLHLFADRAEDLAGKTVVLESTRTNAPRVILRWKDELDKALTKDYRTGYAARVEFGSVVSNRLTGKIYLATPDDAKSYAAGTFNAEIRKPNPPKK